MPPNERDTPRPFRITAAATTPATIQAADGNDAEGKPKLPTFKGVAYTGAPMRPEGWWLPIICDLNGFKIPNQHRPALRQHDHQQIVGHTTVISASEAEGVPIEGVFSGQPEHVEKVTVPAKNGFQWQLSIGANPIRTEFLEAGETATVNGREVTGPLTISRETELGEISFVPLGADGDTSATVSASASNRRFHMFKAMLKAAKANGNVKAGKYSDETVDKMSEDEAKAALKECMADEEPPAKAADDDEDEDDDDDEPPAKAKASKKKTLAASRKIYADEERRIETIRGYAKQYNVTSIEVDGKPVNFVAHAVEKGWNKDKAEVAAMRAGRPSGSVGGPHLHFATKPEMTESVLEAACLHAARHSFRLEDASFYSDTAPDGKTMIRRVPEYLEREVRNDMRARYTDQVQQAAHTMFKGRFSPHQLFQLAFRANGQRGDLDLKSETGIRSLMAEWDHMERSAIRAEGASTISISNVLANVLNKFAMQGYLFVEQAWRLMAGIRPVNDFKATKSINLLGDVMYKQFGPMGELQHASLTDQAFANQAQPFGRILTIPWTYIVNDDLSILTQVPTKIGQGAGLALNDQFWTLWKNMAAGTVNGDDGNAFWRTSSSVTTAAMKAGTAYKANKLSGASSAMSLAALKLAKAMFDNQIDPNGNPLGFDGVKPILLYPPTLWTDVMTALQSPALVAIALGSSTPTVQGGQNVWQNMYEPVMSRYIENANYGNTSAGWWMLFNPVALPVVEVCFLNGVDNPAVMTAGPDYQFDRLGISVRGTMPFGTNAQNFRGGVYAAGL